MAELLLDVRRVLGGGPGDRVLQLRTPFVGGKTHTLVALLHLARDRSASMSLREFADLPDPGPVQVAVLSGEELDPLGVMSASGVETRTLWGELAAQLGCYCLVAVKDAGITAAVVLPARSRLHFVVAAAGTITRVPLGHDDLCLTFTVQDDGTSLNRQRPR